MHIMEGNDWTLSHHTLIKNLLTVKEDQLISGIKSAVDHQAHVLKPSGLRKIQEKHRVRHWKIQGWH